MTQDYKNGPRHASLERLNEKDTPSGPYMKVLSLLSTLHPEYSGGGK